MTETYREMKNRHMRETGSLNRLYQTLPTEAWKKELRAVAQRHATEIMEAWGDDHTGDNFIYDMMLDGAFYGLEMDDILEADGIKITTSEDRRKAEHGYTKALAYYDEHPNGLIGGMA